MGKAKYVFVLADGAVWIWNIIEDRFISCLKGLDFCRNSRMRPCAPGSSLCSRNSSLLPIFYAQPLHAAKLRVGAHNGEAMRSGDSRDLEVIRANDTPVSGKKGTTTPSVGSTSGPLSFWPIERTILSILQDTVRRLTWARN